MNINDLKQRHEIINFLKSYIKKPRGFVVFTGDCGTGKTYAAKAVYNAISPYTLPEYDADIAIFVNQSEMNNIWNKELKEQGHWSHSMKLLSNTKLLVIDDLGKKIPTDSFLDFLYCLVDKRCDSRDRLGTIITTNLSILDIREKFGEAFASRTLSGTNFLFDGKDRRFINGF